MNKIIFVLLLIFLSTAIVLVFTVLIIRSTRIQMSRIREEFKARSEAIIVNYLYNNTATIRDIQNFLNVKSLYYVNRIVLSDVFFKWFVNEKKMRKEIMLAQLMELHKNISGDIGRQIEELYHESGLKEYSYKKLKSNNWTVIVHGIRELTEMNEVDAVNEISIFLDHSNAILHTEAQMSVSRLSPDKDLPFLNNLNTNLTVWEQIHILNTIEDKGYEFVPDFAQWLDSPNNTVVLFAVNMIAYFKQDRALAKLTKLMGHSDPHIRIAVIKTLGSLLNQSSPENTIY